MIDPLLDEKLENLGYSVFRPQPSESDEKVIELSTGKEAVIITRDWDFTEKHRQNAEHPGIIFDPGMHHRPVNEVFEAVKKVLDTLTDSDLSNTVIRLKRFY